VVHRLIFVAFLGFCACGTRISVVGTDRAPAIGGELVVEDVSDEQRSVELDIYGVPTPESRVEGGVVYAVWLVSEDASRIELAGRLAFDPVERSGSLSCLTLLDRFAVIVTAETSASPSSPSDVIILKTAYPIDVRIPDFITSRTQGGEVESEPADPPVEAPPPEPVPVEVTPAPPPEPAPEPPAP
jgi:hypothetical protein